MAQIFVIKMHTERMMLNSKRTYSGNESELNEDTLAAGDCNNEGKSRDKVR